jgi:hypothetical protein
MTTEGAITETALPTATDAGMHALWNPARFTSITDYATWENALLEDDDITQRVQAGELVPINIGSGGAFQFLVRVGTAGQSPALTSRERQYLMVSSQPYLYLSDGTACLSGIEHIGADLGPPVTTLAVPAGPCAVTIHLIEIEWDAEPGAKDAEGDPAPGALPDFVVLISPGGTTANPYRIQLQTFDRD